MRKHDPKQILAVIAVIQSVLPVVAQSAEDVLTPFDLREVKVGGEIGRRIDVTLANNLLKLDVDGDFLRPFQDETRSGKFVGLGMLLDSAVKLAAYSGDPRALALRKHLVAEVLQVQEPNGYIGTFPPDKRIRTIWDVHEMAYVIWGLLTDYRYFGEEPSLAAARQAADFLVENWSVLPPGWGVNADVAPHVAFTGLERTMLGLHRIAGDPAYLDFCIRTRDLPQWDLGIVIGRRAGIEGHIYAYMARCLAQLELFRLQPSAELIRPAARALEFMTEGNGMLVTGSCGQSEIWTDDQDTRGDVGEACALAYQLRVYDSLLRLRGDARLGDLMERTIYNGLFASQSPDGRRLRYFAPLEGNRVYWTTDTYCCPCNFRRIVSELPMLVFYRAADGVSVNLYTASSARLKLDSGLPVAIRQESDYPNSGRVHLAVDPEKPSLFSLRLRIPMWASEARVAVNGKPCADEIEPGTFFAVRRTWQSGDRVELELPMSWRLVKGRQRQAGRVALLRGPQVYCLNPAQNPELAKLDGADLGYLALNPASLRDPVPNAAVRADGLGCRVQMWKPGFSLSPKPDYELTLTEFPDPEGKATYFRLRDFGPASDDELAGPVLREESRIDHAPTGLK